MIVQYHAIDMEYFLLQSQTVKFTPTMNLYLLREVAAVNPYGYTRKEIINLPCNRKPWKLIAENLKPQEGFQAITPRSCQDHTALLIRQWKKEDYRGFRQYVGDYVLTARN